MQFGLIGEKLGHSFSKTIHEALGRYRYGLWPMAPEALPAFMRAKEFDGINVTIPYKQAVLPFCDEVDERARRIGAVNTIVNRDGRLCAYNTDYDGVVCLLQRHGIELGGRRVLILGTGGTSATVQAVAEDLGAESIAFASRSGRDGALTYEAAMREGAAQVIVNCSPAGMYPDNGGLLLDPARFAGLEAVVDVVYNPLKTALVLAAERLGVKAAGGLLMLVAQAVRAAELFSGAPVAADETQRIGRQLAGQMCNLSLVGMPGCGKTSLGKAVAKRLDKRFVDLDEEIVKGAGQEIPDLFAAYGEAHFRALEAEATARAAAEHGQVLSTGGGVVKDAANVAALRQNGPVLFVDCPVERLAVSGGRPLAKDRSDLERLEAERRDLYLAAAHERVEYHPYFKENVARLLAAYEAALDGWIL